MTDKPERGRAQAAENLPVELEAIQKTDTFAQLKLAIQKYLDKQRDKFELEHKKNKEKQVHNEEAPPQFESTIPANVAMPALAPIQEVLLPMSTLVQQIEEQWNAPTQKIEINFSEITNVSDREAIIIKINEVVQAKRDISEMQTSGFKDHLYTLSDVVEITNFEKNYLLSKGVQKDVKYKIAEMFDSEKTFYQSLKALISVCSGYKAYSKAPDVDKKQVLIKAFFEENDKVKAEDITNEELSAFNDFLKAADEIVLIQTKILDLENSIFIKVNNKKIVDIDKLADVMKELTPLISELADKSSMAAIAFETLTKSKIGLRRFNDAEVKREPVIAGKAFNDVFIMPVQRIPRWVMLITELSKSLPTDSNQFLEVLESLQQVKLSATKINEAIRVAQTSNRRNSIDLALGALIGVEKVNILHSNSKQSDIVLKAVGKLIEAIQHGDLSNIQPKPLADAVGRLLGEFPGEFVVKLGVPDQNMTSVQAAQQLSDYISCGFEIKFDPESSIKQWENLINPDPLSVFPITVNEVRGLTPQNSQLLMKRAAKGINFLKENKFNVFHINDSYYQRFQNSVRSDKGIAKLIEDRMFVIAEPIKTTIEQPLPKVRRGSVIQPESLSEKIIPAMPEEGTIPKKAPVGVEENSLQASYVEVRPDAAAMGHQSASSAQTAASDSSNIPVPKQQPLQESTTAQKPLPEMVVPEQPPSISLFVSEVPSIQSPTEELSPTSRADKQAPSTEKKLKPSKHEREKPETNTKSNVGKPPLQFSKQKKLSTISELSVITFDEKIRAWQDKLLIYKELIEPQENSFLNTIGLGKFEARNSQRKALVNALNALVLAKTVPEHDSAVSIIKSVQSDIEKFRLPGKKSRLQTIVEKMIIDLDLVEDVKNAELPKRGPKK